MASKTLYHFLKPLNQRMAANYRLGIGPRRVVMLLTTTGRKSGMPRCTPLQFEELEGDYYIASARGAEADWFKNILANPDVRVQIGDHQFNAAAEPVTDPERITDFIELRIRRHPLMLRLIMHLFDGLPLRYDRTDLDDISCSKALVILHPV